MSLVELIVLLVIAGVCGSIGQSIAGFSRGGLLTSIALGFIGAFLGSKLARELDLPEPFVVTIDDTSFPVLWSILGATLFVAVIAFFSRGRRRA